MIPKIELEFPIDRKGNEVEFITHFGNGGDGCTMYVNIDGNCAYEVTLLKTGLQLIVKEYNGKTYFDKSLENLWWKGEEELC